MKTPVIPTYPSEGWLFDEDRALRDLMKGIVVTDYENRQRHVEAWFGHPDTELREQKYPYITVNLLQIQEGRDRVHRGHLYIVDPPEWWGLRPLTGSEVAYLLEMPTPVDLDYQISTWARNPRHDRQILRQLITGGRTSLRAGLLWTADGKNRRLDFLGHSKRDMEENGKRLFNNIFRVRVSSEVPWGTISDPLYPPGAPRPPAYGLVSRVSIARRIEESGGVLDEDTLVGARFAGIREDGGIDIDLATDGARVKATAPPALARALEDGDLLAVAVDAAEGKYRILGIENRAEAATAPPPNRTESTDA